MPTYADALALFHEWTLGDSLRRHGYAVEAAMAELARQRGADVEAWRIAGLLHDLDYERYPEADRHPMIGVEELARRGYPDEIQAAVLGHVARVGAPRETEMAKALFAVDELAGFVTAVAHVRPGGLDGMTPQSVKKKLKDKRFAAAVSRDDIRQGAAELGVELDDLVQAVIDGMAREASRLGLA